MLAVLLEEGVESVNLIVQVVEGDALGRFSDHGLNHEEKAVDEGGLPLKVLDFLVDQKAFSSGGESCPKSRYPWLALFLRRGVSLAKSWLSAWV